LYIRAMTNSDLHVPASAALVVAVVWNLGILLSLICPCSISKWPSDDCQTALRLLFQARLLCTRRRHWTSQWIKGPACCRFLEPDHNGPPASANRLAAYHGPLAVPFYASRRDCGIDLLSSSACKVYVVSRDAEARPRGSERTTLEREESKIVLTDTRLKFSYVSGRCS
jgi:hypothetical protein